MDKSCKEVIFAKDFMTGKVHGFTYDNVVRSFRVDIEGSSILSPSLSLVESYDYLDGSKGTLHDKDAEGNYIAYDKIDGILPTRTPVCTVRWFIREVLSVRHRYKFRQVWPLGKMAGTN